MPPPRKPISEKKYGVCGSVNVVTKGKITQESNKEGVTVGMFVGRVLDEWASGVILIKESDPNQMSLLGNEEEK